MTEFERRLFEMLDEVRQSTDNEYGCPVCRGGGTADLWDDHAKPPRHLGKPTFEQEDHEPGCALYELIGEARRRAAAAMDAAMEGVG